MNRVAFLGAFAVFALASAVARAEPAADPDPPPSVSSPAQPADPSDWEFQLLLYGWASAIDMTVKAGGVTSNPSASFIDLLKDLEWAVEGGGEVRYKRALVLFDVIGNQLQVEAESNSRTVPFDPPPPGGSIGDLTVGPIKANVRTTLWMFEAAPGWRLYSLPVSDLVHSEPAEDPRKIDFDVFTGIRYWNAKNSVRVNVAPGSLTIDGTTIGLGGLPIPPIDFGHITIPGELLSGGARHVTETVDWVDWILGTRIRADLTEHVSAFVLGDVGGFGIGNSSSLTWQAMAGINWAFAEHASLILAYRALAIDRSNAIENATLHGPMLGVALHF